MAFPRSTVPFFVQVSPEWFPTVPRIYIHFKAWRLATTKTTTNPHSQQLCPFPQSPGSPVCWMTSSQLCHSWWHQGEHSTLAGLVQFFLLNLQTRAKRELDGNGPGTERSQSALEQVSWQAQAIRKPKVQRSNPLPPAEGAALRKESRNVQTIGGQKPEATKSPKEMEEATAWGLSRSHGYTSYTCGTGNSLVSCQ